MKVEELRVYDVLNVKESYIEKYKNIDEDEPHFYLVTYNSIRKTQYNTMIPIDITDEQFQAVKAGKKTCSLKRNTPELFEIRKQAVKWLKEHVYNNK